MACGGFGAVSGDGDEHNPIDVLMERASGALSATRYFEAASDALNALRRARRQDDFERMARICLPLQEARRQIRLLGAEAAGGRVAVVSHAADVPRPLSAGCYLIQPPMIGADARVLRQMAYRARVPVSVLAREPLTRKKMWPIVGVGEISVRVQVAPPEDLERVEDRITKDAFDGVVPVAWFEGAGEALGDSAISKVDESLHPHWKVDELMEALDAVPEHERLHQALAEACRGAVGVPTPKGRRPSAMDNPFSF